MANLFIFGWIIGTNIEFSLIFINAKLASVMKDKAWFWPPATAIDLIGNLSNFQGSEKRKIKMRQKQVSTNIEIYVVHH